MCVCEATIECSRPVRLLQHFYETFFGPLRACIGEKSVVRGHWAMDSTADSDSNSNATSHLITLLMSSRNQIKIIAGGSVEMLVPFIILYLIIMNSSGWWWRWLWCRRRTHECWMYSEETRGSHCAKHECVVHRCAIEQIFADTHSHTNEICTHRQTTRDRFCGHSHLNRHDEHCTEYTTAQVIRNKRMCNKLFSGTDLSLIAWGSD